MILDKLFKQGRTVGVTGNINTAKSSLVLSEILELKKTYPDIDIYAMGVEISLQEYLKELGIKIILSKDDLLDLKITNSIIWIDEFGDLFSNRTRTKETDKLRRFFNRIAHLNNYVIIGSASENFWNKTMCSFIKSFIIKSVDFDFLTNGTNLKRRIMGLEQTSDYRLDIKKNEFYVLSDNLTEKFTFKYNPKLDSKKNAPDLFSEKSSEIFSTKNKSKKIFQ